MKSCGCLFAGVAAGIAPVLAISLACVLVAPTARAGGEAVQTTEQLAEQAYGQQASGKFAEAIATYLKAYEISKDGLTLLNIATIYDRKLHEAALASEYYRRYLIAPDADPDRVKKVTDRLTTLKREAEEERAKSVSAPAPQPTEPAPAAAPTSTPPPETTPPPGGAEAGSGGGAMRATGAVVGIVGVLGLGASFALGYIAKGKNDDANAVCKGTVCSSENGVSLAKDAGTFATASTAAFVAGLVFVGGGITLIAAAPSGTSASKAGRVFLAPRVDTTGGGIVLHGDF
jgi:hypothetical protein